MIQHPHLDGRLTQPKVKASWFQVILFTAALIFASVLVAHFTGCASPERTTLNVTAVQIQTVDAAMRAFVDYEKQYGASAELRARVASAYQQTRLADLAVESSLRAVVLAQNAGEDVTAKQAAAAQARKAQADAVAALLAIIQPLIK